VPKSVATFLPPTGPSTVARIIDKLGDDRDPPNSIVAALRLSGLIGFDFMIEAGEPGAAWLIEDEPSQYANLCALRLGPRGVNLAEGVWSAPPGRPGDAAGPATPDRQRRRGLFP